MRGIAKRLAVSNTVNNDNMDIVSQICPKRREYDYYKNTYRSDTGKIGHNRQNSIPTYAYDSE